MQSPVTANSSLLLGKKMPLKFVAAGVAEVDEDGRDASERKSPAEVWELAAPEQAVRGDDDLK